MQGNMNERFRRVIRRLYQNAKVGATAGWTVNAAADTFMSTMAAGGTNSTLIIPLTGLEVGDKITGYHLLGQMDSAGNTATIAAKLAKFTPVAAGSVAADLAGTTMSTVTATADKALSDANAIKLIADGYVVTVEENTTYFAVITATTAATTDIELLGLVLHLLRDN